MYLDGFAAEIADTVTIHHLLTHTSGLGDYMGMPGYWETARSWTNAAQALAGTMDFIRRETTAFPAGSGTVYSNSGYFLLGEIVARASGQSFTDYLREHVFRPAGMASTGCYTKPQWRDNPRIARPYRKEPSGERVDTLEEHTFLEGVFATCGDMDRLARALLGNKLLTPAATQLVLSGKLPSRPMGRNHCSTSRPTAGRPPSARTTSGPTGWAAAAATARRRTSRCTRTAAGWSWSSATTTWGTSGPSPAWPASSSPGN